MTSKVVFWSLIVVSFLLNGCLDEEETWIYIAQIKNQSNTSMTIEGYFLGNLSFENQLEQSQTSKSCRYDSITFTGYRCYTDSIVIKFPNGKGYISTPPFPPSSANEFDFPDKSPFTSTGYTNVGNNTYEFIITEEDYNNAFDID